MCMSTSSFLNSDHSNFVIQKFWYKSYIFSVLSIWIILTLELFVKWVSTSRVILSFLYVLLPSRFHFVPENGFALHHAISVKWNHCHFALEQHLTHNFWMRGFKIFRTIILRKEILVQFSIGTFYSKEESYKCKNKFFVGHRQFM